METLNVSVSQDMLDELKRDLDLAVLQYQNAIMRKQLDEKTIHARVLI